MYPFEKKTVETVISHFEVLNVSLQGPLGCFALEQSKKRRKRRVFGLKQSAELRKKGKDDGKPL